MAGASRERGAVLILALLIVALVTGLSVSFAEHFDRSLGRAESRWLGDQARAYLIGAEALAAFVLKDDADKDGDTKVDDLDEEWAQQQPPFELDGGWLQASLSDAQGRFNVNLLADKVNAQGTTTEAERFTENQRRFIRLLQTFKAYPLDQAQAIEITEAVVDWIDADDEPTGFGGAESLYYSGLEQPYSAPNRALISVTELMRVKYMTPELFQLLEPHLVALNDLSGLNVNTMSLTLLRSLNSADSLQPLAATDAQAIIDERTLGAFASLDEFTSNPVVAGLGSADKPVVSNGLLTSSKYFLLTAQAQVGEQRRRAQSLLFRNPEQGHNISVLRRSDYQL